MAGFTAAFVAIAAAQSPPSTSGDWRGEPKFGACLVSQQADPSGTMLVVSRVPGTDRTEIRLQDRKGWLNSVREIEGVMMKLEPGWSTVTTADLGPGSVRRSREVAVLIEDQAFIDRFAAASAVELSHQAFGTIRAAIRSPAAAVEILRGCEDRGMRKWGIDPVAWRALKSRPVPATPYHGWLQADDYPPVALYYGVQADLLVRLTVGANGAIRDCVGLSRSVNAAFTKATCGGLLKRGRFHPARDAQGRPTEAATVFVVLFRRRT